MLFSSQVFLLLFLPIVLLLFYKLNNNPAARKIWLILASLFFYSYWDVRFLPLLLGSTITNYYLAKFLVATPSKFKITLGVSFNLLLLGIFKYFNFFAATLTTLTGFNLPTFSIILPLGISFFTFQQLSYLVDIYRKEARMYCFSDYLLYVSFFPQLIAGPIVRHNEIISQFNKSPINSKTYENLSKGLLLLICGIIKKILIADTLAKYADPLFTTLNTTFALNSFDMCFAMLAFGLQIYFDFSGYTDMALGLGKMFGYELPQNFQTPYLANSIRDFWRRWHITLSRFLRDYLYIPLGGSKHGFATMSFALIMTMLLAGLWHGANWTFVLWGTLHGLALLANHAFAKTNIKLPKIINYCLTLSFVFLTWIIFRAENFTTVYNAFYNLTHLNFTLAKTITVANWELIVLAFMVATLGPTAYDFVHEKWQQPRVAHAFLAAVIAVALLLEMGAGKNIEFIYFQF